MLFRAAPALGFSWFIPRGSWGLPEGSRLFHARQAFSRKAAKKWRTRPVDFCPYRESDAMTHPQVTAGMMLGLLLARENGRFSFGKFPSVNVFSRFIMMIRRFIIVIPRFIIVVRRFIMMFRSPMIVSRRGYSLAPRVKWWLLCLESKAGATESDARTPPRRFPFSALAADR